MQIGNLCPLVSLQVKPLALRRHSRASEKAANCIHEAVEVRHGMRRAARQHGRHRHQALCLIVECVTQVGLFARVVLCAAPSKKYGAIGRDERLVELGDEEVNVESDFQKEGQRWTLDTL